MATAEESLTYEPLLDRDGVKVSKSPWGPDDEIGRLNWLTSDTNRAILEHLDGAHVFDLNVEYFLGMPSWVAAGDPPYGIWMTHTPQGSINDTLSGVSSAVHEKYSYCGDSIHMYTHCGTHIDTLNHLGHYGMFWNGWTPDKDLGSRLWNKGGAEKYPPVIARGVLLDVAGLHGTDCLPDGYAITPDDLENAASEQRVEIRPRSVVLVRTGRMTKWPDFDGYLKNPPGIGLPAAKYLCEQAGAMCIAGRPRNPRSSCRCTRTCSRQPAPRSSRSSTWRSSQPRSSTSLPSSASRSSCEAPRARRCRPTRCR